MPKAVKIEAWTPRSVELRPDALPERTPGDVVPVERTPVSEAKTKSWGAEKAEATLCSRSRIASPADIGTSLIALAVFSGTVSPFGPSAADRRRIGSLARSGG